MDIDIGSDQARGFPTARWGWCLRAVTTVVLAVGSSATFASPASAGGADAAEVRASRAADAFATRLREALVGQLQTAGPVAAVEFCRQQAPLIAATVMAEHGVRLGRVAVPGRQRNPAHAPHDWQVDMLDGFARSVAAGAPAAGLQQVLREDLSADVELRMARSIAVEPPCLQCHGRVLAEDVAAAVRATYPDDAATGFDVGDLRGALWVEVPVRP